jgi:hypothetical protein
MSSQEQFDWLTSHGVVDISPDHMGRVSIRTQDALRLRRESDEQAERALRNAARARPAHTAAVAELRSAVAAAFLEQTGGEAVVSPDRLLVTVGERRAGEVATGLEAARAVWSAAPFEVRVEVNQISVSEGDTTMSYDLSTVLPRATVEDGIARAVARFNRGAR